MYPWKPSCKQSPLDISHNSIFFFNIQIQLIAWPFGVMDSLGEQAAQGLILPPAWYNIATRADSSCSDLLIGMNEH